MKNERFTIFLFFFNGVKVNFACHIGEGDNVITMMSDETVCIMQFYANGMKNVVHPILGNVILEPRTTKQEVVCNLKSSRSSLANAKLVR